ncbi:hypothetical protein MCC93_25130 [Morococcus cerebrosus]|uniref:Uncharacterized protein n=1 Tax=Morococcus cerebrosus TaxID=1056807 RepID=A0A0C1EB10_9NEIS|nr:hypothetical protein MCC93_25130 [Morococcus cerebrosus]
MKPKPMTLFRKHCDEERKKSSEKPNLGFQTTFSFTALMFIR